jgi:hypothetical protein
VRRFQVKKSRGGSLSDLWIDGELSPRDQPTAVSLAELKLMEATAATCEYCSGLFQKGLVIDGAATLGRSLRAIFVTVFIPPALL